MSISFGGPAGLRAQVALELAVPGLNISGANQAAILAFLPNGSWPTFAQLESAENLTRSLYDTAMTAARATGNNATVAATDAMWATLAGFRDGNIWDVARTAITTTAVPTS
jgi:hypothetical protein